MKCLAFVLLLWAALCTAAGSSDAVGNPGYIAEATPLSDADVGPCDREVASEYTTLTTTSSQSMSAMSSADCTTGSSPPILSSGTLSSGGQGTSTVTGEQQRTCSSTSSTSRTSPGLFGAGFSALPCEKSNGTFSPAGYTAPAPAPISSPTTSNTTLYTHPTTTSTAPSSPLTPTAPPSQNRSSSSSSVRGLDAGYPTTSGWSHEYASSAAVRAQHTWNRVLVCIFASICGAGGL